MLTDNIEIVDRILMEGYLQKISHLLFAKSTDSIIKRNILWSLSNLFSDHDRYTREFFTVEGLPGQVLNIMQSSHYSLQPEAAWVITNILTGTKQQQLLDWIWKEGLDS